VCLTFGETTLLALMVSMFAAGKRLGVLRSFELIYLFAYTEYTNQIPSDDRLLQSFVLRVNWRL
jgi:hypothetical protein